MSSPMFIPKDEESHVLRRLPYMYPARVVANEDPKGLRRIKFEIPGLIEPESPWALPIGTAGGGSANRGGVIVPEIKATVAVQFAFGDPAHPYYHSGPPAEGESQEEDPNKFVLRYDDFEVRWEKVAQILSVKNTRTGDEVTFNGITASMRVYAVASLEVKAEGKVSIEGAILELNGRPVMPGGPI